MSAEVTPEASTRAERLEASRRFLEESFNEGNLALADQYLAPESIDHDPAMPTHLDHLRGPDRFKAIVKLYREAFPDIRMKVEESFCDGDAVIMRWRSTGTHRGGLLAFAPTGASVEITGIDILRWSGDKIVEGWGQWDNLGLARQIGAAPPEGSTGDRLGQRLQHLTARRMRRRTHV
jgi:predicted ester cyclase